MRAVGMVGCGAGRGWDGTPRIARSGWAATKAGETADARRSTLIRKMAEDAATDTGDGIDSRGGAETAEGSDKRKGSFLRAPPLRSSFTASRVSEGKHPEKRRFAAVVLRIGTDSTIPPTAVIGVMRGQVPTGSTMPRRRPAGPRPGARLCWVAVALAPSGASEFAPSADCLAIAQAWTSVAGAPKRPCWPQGKRKRRRIWSNSCR